MESEVLERRVTACKSGNSQDCHLEERCREKQKGTIEVGLENRGREQIITRGCLRKKRRKRKEK
jgi:hypothetical protein